MTEPHGNSNDIWLAFLSFCSAVLYAVKNYDDFKEVSRWVRFRKLIYGTVGSALTTWVMFEILMYLNLPPRLCLALGASCGYLGAEVVSRIAIGFIEAKIGNSKKIKEDKE